MRKKESKKSKRKIFHEQVFCERRFFIDVHILPICRKMWKEGIETFFSCQGGASLVSVTTRKVHSTRAYIVILKKDEKKALRLLKELNPKVDPRGTLEDPYRSVIRFDPPHFVISGG